MFIIPNFESLNESYNENIEIFDNFPQIRLINNITFNGLIWFKIDPFCKIWTITDFARCSIRSKIEIYYSILLWYKISGRRFLFKTQMAI